MQLLSALEPIVEMLWLAICAAAIFIALGMIGHAAALLARRLRSVAFRSRLHDRARRLGAALAPLP